MPAWTRRIERWFRGGPRVVFHPEYRLPLPTFTERTGMDSRRGEMVIESLVHLGILAENDVLRPELVRWDELARVHDAAWLEALTTPEALAAVFAVDIGEVAHSGLLSSIRRTVGGTILAARAAVEHGGPVLNLGGGFHHARPERGHAFCPVNDLAVAIAAVRADGFSGSIAVIDLDAHPPDGVALCLGKSAWIGSISGSEWPAPEGVDEIAVPPGTEDEAYLGALATLLSRAPRCALTFVVAGADVRAGDRMGRLSLSEAGVRRRDQSVFEFVGDRPSVWLPAGGYRPDSWRVLAGTALVLSGHAQLEIPTTFDPIHVRFRRLGSSLRLAELGANLDLTAADIDESLRHAVPDVPRLLGTYTAAGVELALERYGLLLPVRQLGYSALRVVVERVELGDRFQLFGTARGGEHLLVETVLSQATIEDKPMLFVHWMTMRHPMSTFSPQRPALPGQDAPGLGLFRESLELHDRMAERLGLAGVAMRPAYVHVAAAVRNWMVCVDPAEQHRLDQLFREHRELGLAELSRRVHAGEIRLEGKPFTWSAPLMYKGVRAIVLNHDGFKKA